MSDLIIHNQFDKLPESLRQYAINRVGRKAIKDLHPNEVKRNCTEIIAKTYAEDGKFQVTSEMISFQSQALFEELTGRFKDLTIDELKEAFRLGIRGETGAYFGLCAKTYHQFIKHYFERKERSEAMKEYLNLINRVNQKETTEEQKYQIMKQASLQEFESYSKTKNLSRSAPYVYDFIAKKYGTKATLSGEDIYILISDKGIRETIKKDAKAEYEKSLNMKVLKGEARKKDAEKAMFDLVTNRSYLNIAKTIELGIYFDGLIKDNQKLIL